MIQRFKGIVTMGSACRVDEPAGAIHIGGRDVVKEIADAVFSGTVTACILDERFEGALSVETGWGYSEWTPMDNDKLSVGPHDLVEIVERYEGKEIILIIADEPVNVLDP